MIRTAHVLWLCYGWNRFIYYMGELLFALAYTAICPFIAHLNGLSCS